MISRKGQMSLMILGGLVILVAAGLGIYYFMEGFEIDDSVIMDSIRADSAASPVERFILSCIEQTAEDAVRLIARNGGYIYPRERFAMRQDAHESELITRGPNVLPYWYMLDTREGVFKSNAPPLTDAEGSDSVEEQIRSYVDDNVGSCFNDFSGFDDRYDVDADELQADVVVSLDSVSVDATMPIVIESLADGSSRNLERFTVQLDARLGRLFRMAADIATTQSEFGFVERPVLEALSTHSGLNRQLPPFYDIELFSSGAENIWTRQEVHEYIRRMILPFTSELQILFTRNYEVPPAADELGSQSLKEISTQDLYDSSLDGDYTDLAVNFNYPSSIDPHISIGADDAVLRPESGEVDGFGLFSDMINTVVRRYRFGYDISYPVVVRICEEMSFNDEGLCFYIALEGNIRNNEIFYPASTDLVATPLDAPHDHSALSFDDDDMLVDREISFTVRDAMTRSPVDGAILYYLCGERHYIRTLRERDGMTEFTGKLPFCAAGGRIALNHPDYHSSLVRFNNREDGNDVRLRDIEMKRLHRLDFEVKIKDLIGSGVDELGDKDQVVLEIRRKKDDPAENDVPLITTHMVGDPSVAVDQTDVIKSAAAEAGSDISGPAIEEILEYQAELEISGDAPQQDYSFELVPGEYDVTLTHIIHGSPAVHIPEDEISEGWGPFKTTETLPEINIPTWVSSEVEFEMEIGEELYDSDTMTFFVPRVPLPADYDDLDDFDTGVDVNMNRFMPELGVSQDG